ncbi:MAG: glycosyltransferase family 2 protein [Candidatus Aceula meridiana]|nr:glycosyltransferase family 2 protein [Candidatus Aceula meridiana]
MISIALATYNGEKYLREQLDSIYGQTYKDIEVVVCDDCSTDGTMLILKEYENKHGLRVYCNEKNLGYIKNFEKAVLLCRGEYVALSDQDDMWVPQKLETLMKELGHNLLIFSDLSLVAEDGKEIAKSASRYNRVNLRRALAIQYMAFRNYINGCTILFRRELVKKAVPFNPHVPHDYWLAMFALNENRLTYVPDQLVKYRQHSDNEFGMQPTTLSNMVIRIAGIKEELAKMILNEQELASCEKFCDDFKQVIRRAAYVCKIITSENTSFFLRCFYFLRYFKYLSQKSFGSWILLRILRQ